MISVLIVHNRYQWRGGEDAVVDSEIALLRERGHHVDFYERLNSEILDGKAISTALEAIWSLRTAREIRDILRTAKPRLIHVHNTFPLISPSVYWVAAENHIPVVQTLHNFRLLCPQATFLRDGKVCQECLGHIPWRAVRHRCYRESFAQSTVLAGMLMAHRGLGTYARKVSKFIALNEFCRRKFIEAGLPPEKIAVKPNFVDIAAPAEEPRSGFLYVGRLSHEKGISLLSDAANRLSSVQLTVIGSGKEHAILASRPQIRMLGERSPLHVEAEMRRAVALVIPSICYESFPRTFVEAFACALPIIAGRIGPFEELIDNGITGLLFDPGNTVDLGEKLSWANAHQAEMRVMGLRARKCYEDKFTSDSNYRQLMSIYESVC